MTRHRALTFGFLLTLNAAAIAGYGCNAGTPGDLKARPGAADGTGDGTTPGAGDGSNGTTGGAITPAGLTDRRVRRLTRAEYGATVQDLLHVTKDYGAALPPDSVVNGFGNNADALSVDQLFADNVRMNAEDIASSIDVKSILPCSADGGAACAKQFVQTFGQKALRRPVRDDEVQRYAALYDAVSPNGGFDAGVRAILEAMLQSPSFLYRTEIGSPGAGATKGAPVALTAYEIASELSYLFWQSMPDDRLFQLAQTGELAKPEVVAQEAARLFDSPRASAMLATFVSQWLEVDRLSQAQKDPNAYPNFNDGIRNDLRGETLAFFEGVARDPQGSLSTLLTADYSYLTPSLAQFYGVQVGSGAAVNGFVKTTVAPARGGILTHGSLLATEATPTAANPVRRGKLVRVRVLCQDVPPPPPGLVGMIPPLDPNAPTRTKFSNHSSNPACAGCHKLLDPIGFGFEQFDGVGRLLGGNVDSSGEIVGFDGDGKFNGVRELESKLAVDEAVTSCFVRQWVRYGLGVSDTTSTGDEVTRLTGAFKSQNESVRALVASLTQAPYFYSRSGEDIPPPDGN